MNPDAALEQQLTKAAKVVEQYVDAELEKLETLGDDDLDRLRKERMQEMKKLAEKKSQWLQNGHGHYEELSEEKQFFEVSQKSENVVCHFYREEAFRCKIVDKHMPILAKKHLETKFCKLNAEKSPFLTQRLKIQVLPCLVIVKDAKTKDFIFGFTDLGNTDDFSTEMLEWRLAQSGVINYNGDLMSPPDGPGGSKKKQPVTKRIQKRAVRGGAAGSDSDEDE
ncbi:unnamed protein product [Cyprideis torosa]|uniref:Phosducin domain-containing protein n=1 Tax=Cyprideis torosa TaxID=163714 RepID=A0A7R8ZJZ8_9CRUS|nr:unnamed protein product [Cyprideis torosa]CAG0889662.1 unnamed protein product [Cyprideis torosa]